MSLLSRLMALAGWGLLGWSVHVAAAELHWLFPTPAMSNSAARSARRIAGSQRLSQDPYRSAAFLRSDFSFETNRIFANYSGDISGRFIEIASLTSPPGQMTPEPPCRRCLQDIGRYQKADGHFGRDVDWNAARTGEPQRRDCCRSSGATRGCWSACWRRIGRSAGRICSRPRSASAISTSPPPTAFSTRRAKPNTASTGTYAAGYVDRLLPGHRRPGAALPGHAGRRVPAAGRAHGRVLQAVRHAAHRSQPRQPDHPLRPAPAPRDHRQARVPRSAAARSGRRPSRAATSGRWAAWARSSA